MGLFDFLFGASDEKLIEKYKKSKDVRNLAPFVKHEDPEIRKKAIEALVYLIDNKQIPETHEKAILDLLDPMIRIRDRKKVDAINDPQMLKNMAINEYLKNRDTDMAIYALKRADSIKPEDSGILNALAASFSRADKFEAAQEIWETILKKNPNDSTAKDNYSTALYITGEKIIKKAGKKDGSSGADMLLKALELTPNNVNCILELGEYYKKIKLYDTAIEYFSKCLNNAKLPAGFNSTNEMKGMMAHKIAETYHEAGNYRDAYDNYRHSLLYYNWPESDRIRINETLKELEKLGV
ncbi:MAG: tetratricopeptide repeat protein [Firmicutes bacterium]|nr:tetratricopeptide repeat protein [Bacillota bacterium]